MGSGHGSGSGLFRAGSPSGLTLPMPCTGQGLAPDPQPPGHLGPAQPASRGAAHPEPILHPQLTVCRAGLQGARATLLLPRPTGARRPQSREPATSRARGQASNRGPGGKCSLRSVGWGLRRPPPQRLQAPAAGRRPQARVPKGQQPSCGGTCLPEGGVPQTGPVQTPPAPWACPGSVGSWDPQGGGDPGKSGSPGECAASPALSERQSPPGGPSVPLGHVTAFSARFGRRATRGVGGPAGSPGARRGWTRAPHAAAAAALGLPAPWLPCTGQVCRNVTCLGWGRASEPPSAVQGPGRWSLGN